MATMKAVALDDEEIFAAAGLQVTLDDGSVTVLTNWDEAMAFGPKITVEILAELLTSYGWHADDVAETLSDIATESAEYALGELIGGRLGSEIRHAYMSIPQEG